MDLIAENPYRTLGIFGGASIRELQRQLAMVKAFSRVGKQSKLKTDFEFLGGGNSPAIRNNNFLIKIYECNKR